MFEHRGTTTAFDLLATYSRFLENMPRDGLLPLRDAQSRLRRLPHVPRVLPQPLPRHHRRPGGADGRGHRRHLVPARRRAAAPRRPGRGARRRRRAAVAGRAERGASPRSKARPDGKEWLADLEQVKDPWFYYSTGSGYCHANRAWIDDLRPPFAALGDYVPRVERGEDLARPLEHLRSERERIAAGYRALLDEEDAAGFDNLLALSRQVFPFVENHNFYVEHWHHSIFFNKVRELGAVMVAGGMLEDADDIFFLHRYEVYSLLYEAEVRWAIAVPTRGEFTWREEVARRRRIYAALEAWSPPAALGVPPERVTEPITVTLFGITTETINRWLAAEGGAGSDDEFQGLAASPGVAEGVARVVHGVDELASLSTARSSSAR